MLSVFSLLYRIIYTLKKYDKALVSVRVLAEVANQENQSNNLRKTAWVITATDMIPNDPLLGVGIGNWKVRFLQYENSYSPHYIYMYKNHNDFLELTAEAGIFAGVGVLGYLPLDSLLFPKRHL